MKSLGICIGASNISYVILEKKETNIKIMDKKTIQHEGNPKNIINSLIKTDVFKNIEKVAITGRKFKNILNFSTISEPEAIEIAYQFEKDKYKNINIIVSAGGETFIAYCLDKNGKIINVYTGNKCASGTGEFFNQQLRRMNLNIEDAMQMELKEDNYKLASRCSVFCKSDCTHALNKGVNKDVIVSGLCDMMASKILELINKEKQKNILMIGGVSKNNIMIDFLRKKVDSIYISENSNNFEALGTALWAMNNETNNIKNENEMFTSVKSSFSFLPSLNDYKDKVIFKNTDNGIATDGDICILGLDVGSTTTKAVLMREKDNLILASTYLRTNGDPINASKLCYSEILKQLHCKVKIIGLGVTGSGRNIAGLHALTPGIINEIIAHATASVYYDKDVDTIFEIGGQDAKYTYLINGVPTDYAMNEACSAGTGSFLEEIAKECLDIDTTEIGDIALNSKTPPDFSDQCSAFISSDVKNAIQEGITTEDISAGLVYSICMNYVNRVKGNRIIGNKILMQGGVCYNKAIPVAMSYLTGKTIIVPPNPGLMGAFGVALDIKNKIQQGFIKESEFNLEELKDREVTYKDNFTCAGGKEKCDRKCSVNRIVINDKVYPFGGACNKYYNVIHENKEIDTEQLDFVRLREKLIFEKYSVERGKNILPKNGKRVGINRSLMTNTLYPLYYNFFIALGYEVILSKEIDKQGIEKKGAAFCYPIEISHGMFHNLMLQSPDIYFLPHIKSMHVKNGTKASVTCPFVQGEPYYLDATFNNKSIKLTPTLDFTNGYETQIDKFIKLGEQLGYDKKILVEAFNYAVLAQNDFHKECLEIGKKILEKLDKEDKMGIVLFGRPYNAFTKYANMGISHKFASKGYYIVPHDFLSYENEEKEHKMYWAMGQMIMKAAKYVKKHPRLFGTYITNFSCGPDSFLLGYFRNIMKEKPSLTLELDSHTADAGIDTRIEAFIDVINSYNNIKKIEGSEKKLHFNMAKVFSQNGKMIVEDSDGKQYSLKNKKVHILFPSMGKMGSKLLAATFRYGKINATSVEQPTNIELKIGRSLTSCKECLPLTLTVGSFIHYINNRKNKDEILIYFMPETSGPCRFGQYNVLMKNVIEKLQIKNVALLSLNSENSYAGLKNNIMLRTWQSIIISDILEDIYSSILVLSEDKEKALEIYKEVCEEVENSIEKDSFSQVKKTLNNVVQKLNTIKIKKTMEETKKVALIGEIYVRRDSFSRKNLIEKLSEKDIIVRVAHVSEWIYYCDYISKNKLVIENNKSMLKMYIEKFLKNAYEKEIKTIFGKSNFYEIHLIDIEKMIKIAEDLISPKLTGEAILTVASALTEIIEEVHGVISIGPFGCMPSRIAESILNTKMYDKKLQIAEENDIVKKVMDHYPILPFLSIETDGNVFPQIVEARLEVFCMQVERIHEYMNYLSKSS